MESKSLDRHIEATPGIAGGKPRIAGRRITVENIVVWSERLGMSPDDIAAEFELSLADIHAALAFYFDHREEIDRSLADGEAFAEALRRRTPSKVIQKIREREADGAAG